METPEEMIARYDNAERVERVKKVAKRAEVRGRLRNMASTTGLGIAGVCLLLVSLVCMVIIINIGWNLCMPQIFGLPEIGYWEALGLVVLTKLSFIKVNFNK